MSVPNDQPTEDRDKAFSKAFETRVEALNTFILNIEYRQQEIQTYIAAIDRVVNNIESLITKAEMKNPPDISAVIKLQIPLGKNIELIATLYSTYQRFEDSKFKYNKEIDDFNMNAVKLINLEFRKLDKNLAEIEDGDFMKMMMSLSKQLVASENGQSCSQPDFNSANVDATLELDSPEYLL